MKTIDNKINYYELLMSYDDTSKYIDYELPDGYSYKFYEFGDEIDWVNIHIYSGEFTSIKEGLKNFHNFYDHFISELHKRCIFIVDDKNNEKIGTATISLLKKEENGCTATVDWLAIKKDYQGKKLARPLISKVISLAHELGHDKLMLHTQTTTSLAVKLYLEAGFKPVNIDSIGWKIIKRLINSNELINIDSATDDEMFDKRNIQIEKQLDEMYGKDNYHYSVWDKNSLHNVNVFSDNKSYEYKYFIENNNNIRLERINNYICRLATLEDISNKFDYEIAISKDKDNWIEWKNKTIDSFNKKLLIVYVGILNDEIITECTAAIDPSIVQNSDGLVDDKKAYLMAFRTNIGYRGMGYFSILFKFMIDDLKGRGYVKATLGVEPEELTNKAIYSKYCFNKFIKKSYESFPDGSNIEVEYYEKEL